jgi:hypothetical protein
MAITSSRSAGPFRPISFTASEITARRIVERLCQEPPCGLAWKDYAVWEIARAIAAAAPPR